MSRKFDDGVRFAHAIIKFSDTNYFKDSAIFTASASGRSDSNR